MKTPLEKLIEQLEIKKSEALAYHDIHGRWAYEIAIELAEELLEYEKSLIKTK